jgi:surfeit locus 1 family protein
MPGFRFRPRVIPTLATLVTFPILLSLGFWQLDRAQQKEASLAAFDARGERPPISLNASVPDPVDDLFREADARGVLDADHQLLLDNQVYRQEAGYHVLTPLLLEGGDAAILVDRGWVPTGRSRRDLPDLPISGAPTALRGHLDHGPPTGIRLGGIADGEAGWPLRIQFIDYDELSTRLGYELLPMVLRMDASLPGGFVRQWRPDHPSGFGPERNRGYAVQWFALAAALLVIFIVVNLTRIGKD